MRENTWRTDFTILEEKIYGKPLVYLDNAATSQMPVQVINRLEEHYRKEHANIHRGIHYLSEKSTESVENAREKIQRLLGAGSPEEIIFTQGTTDSIHLVSAGISLQMQEENSLEAAAIPGIVTTQMEHHSNYVPWQQLCRQTGAAFYVCPAPDGNLDLKVLEDILKNHRIRLVACAHVSNLTGTVNPIKQVTQLAHRYGAEVLIDGAQGILHCPVNVQEIDCDYYCFSGHKMLGPTGIGVLYGKKKSLEALPPVRFGGGMVNLVTEEKTGWGPLPYRLEAGTPHIAGIIGLGAAVDYLTDHDFPVIRKYCRKLTAYTAAKLEGIPGIRILGHPKERDGAVSFTAKGVHPYDIASIIDKAGIAVRSGNLCAQPMLQALQETSAVRVSPAFYNTEQEIDYLAETLEKVIPMLKRWK